ncbi:hypothetical protein EYC84_005393 [Monilinia fructicola]|uniref:Uncharacterized protein n=1 Tax=Monilinia fructicola TaxID=38448 RepID=A0A5M9K072_MONFR|nr:hypothetical protein EYC84_005393 [Monilinia fructicola]
MSGSEIEYMQYMHARRNAHCRVFEVLLRPSMQCPSISHHRNLIVSHRIVILSAEKGHQSAGYSSREEVEKNSEGATTESKDKMEGSSRLKLIVLN